MNDFELIYLTAVGQIRCAGRVPWVKNIFVEGTAYNRAYENFWIARENLCTRFNLDWEDPDLELFMNGILELEQDLAYTMFWNGMEYAKRNCKL